MEQVNDNNLALQLFEGEQVRFVWDEEKEIYYFSVVDIVRILTESADATAYWRKLKQRLKEEGNETVTNCHALKLPAADGKNRLTDVADLEGIFRIIQSVPSKKAEPVKQWLAEIGHQRIDQMIDPELTFQMAVEDYRRQGYSDRWINERMKSIQMRKELTDEWHRAGVHEQKDFAILTNVLTKAWSGMTTGEYKQYKGLTKENLRDNMTNIELALNTLVEVERHTSDGRMDVLMQTHDYIYVIEIKVDQNADVAMQQIEQRQYAAPFACDPRRLFKIGINFNSASRTIDSWRVG